MNAEIIVVVVVVEHSFSTLSIQEIFDESDERLAREGITYLETF